MNDVTNAKEASVGILGQRLSLTVTYGDEDKFFTVRMTKKEADTLARHLTESAALLPDI